MTRWSVGLAFVGAIFALATPASAQETHGFGRKGSLILSVDRLMPFISFSNESVTRVRGGSTEKISDSGASMALLLGREPTLGAVHTIPRVAFDYAIVDRLTLGGAFAVGAGLSRTEKVEATPNAGGPMTSRESNQPKQTIVGFAPRVGYVLPLSRAFAFWPRAGFAFYSSSSGEDIVDNAGNVVGNDSETSTVFSLDLDPQFALVPIEHFFIHFGPVLNIPLAGARSTTSVRGNQSTTFSDDLTVFHFGIAAGIGGWFDL